MTMELSSRDGYCGLWPVGSPHRLGSLGVATAPTTAGGTPEKGLSLGAEVKRGAQSPRAEGSYLVYPIVVCTWAQGWVGGGRCKHTGLCRWASKQISNRCEDQSAPPFGAGH